MGSVLISKNKASEQARQQRGAMTRYGLIGEVETHRRQPLVSLLFDQNKNRVAVFCFFIFYMSKICKVKEAVLLEIEVFSCGASAASF